jgi:hypothetical protein
MRDMKHDRETWRDKHEDGIYMAKTAGGVLILSFLVYALYVAAFAM